MAAVGDISSWVGGLAAKVWEPQKGLPFGSYLHANAPRRHRTLTGPLDHSQESFWHRIQVLSAVEPEQRTYLQDRCKFLLMLPLDVRLIIYDMVLGGMAFHIGSENHTKRMLATTCLQPSLIGLGDHQDCLAPSSKRPSSAPREDYPQATGLLPLLVTCRRIYSEAITTLYSANTFEFWENRMALRFLRGMFPPQRLASIRRFRWAIQIPHHPLTNAKSQRDWSDLFRFFATETSGLQHLWLKLNRNHPFEAVIEQTPDDEAKGWVEPIIVMAVDANRTRGFKVEIVTNGIVHEPEKIYREIEIENPGLPRRRVLDATSTELHRRIRVSFHHGPG